MEIALCLLFGYLLGSLSPAALIAKIKNKNLRTEGTGNLGATNTLMVVGKKYGVIVMIIDIAKAYIAVHLAELIFPTVKVAGLVAGSSTVVGHIYPFYMKFKGGKGLAAYGGMVLAFDPLIFVILLGVCTVIMLIINSGVALTLSAAILFPILTALFLYETSFVLVAAGVSALLFVRHIPNLCDALHGKDIKARTFIKKFVIAKRTADK